MPAKKLPPKAAAPAASTVSAKEAFWNTLDEEDAKIAKAWDCSSQEHLDKVKAKKKADEQKAKTQQYYDLKKAERNQQWEKEEQKKQREKAREERKQEEEFEKVKKRAFAEKVVEAVWYDDNKCWRSGYVGLARCSRMSPKAQISPGTWKEVQGEFFCTLCEKSPNGSSLEGHLNSEAHKKKLAWATGTGYTAAPAAAAPAAPQLCLPCPPTPADLPSWQQMGPDGLVRCLPCGKVVDDNHLMTGDHTRRLTQFLEQEKIKITGYAPPALEYLAWVPCDDNDPNSERWMKCLLCSKWVQDETSHSGTPSKPEGSKEHQKNLRNYDWYKATVVQQRQKYHPVGAVSKAGPKAPAKVPPPPPPTDARPKPTPAPWGPPITKAPPAKQPPPSRPFLDPEPDDDDVEEC
ncbi:unnamed protein product [Symbiodinium natans]|uniref:U1-type domain-containing protein n=1 Tax=Symbiodinium natans TaxID=878477 RepID=A0A812UJS5_9DINO|nr:unnamed protein product [Symbiodinium natans]